jgi:head-tail adaptor
MNFNNSGRLRNLMDVESLVVSGDFTDGDSWLLTTRMYCELRPATGRQSNEGDEKVPIITHIIRTRNNDFTWKVGTHRFRFGERIFHIEYVIDPSERGDFLEFGCTEVIA